VPTSGAVRRANIGLAVVLLLTAAFSTGCITIAHEAGAFDWWGQSTRTKTETKSVAVTSEPQGAAITRQDPKGSETQIGTSPLVDRVAIGFDEKVETPKTTALWIGASVELVGGFALMIFGTQRSTVTGGGGTEVLIGMSGSCILSSGIVDAIVAAVHGGKSERITRDNKPLDYRYAAHVDGVPEGAAIAHLPDQPNVHIVLATRNHEPVTKVGWIIAVMNVEDADEVRGEASASATDPGILANLSDQIRVFVAQRGVRTIDRSAQENAIKAKIARIKSDSYNACYDNSCQIELGKALAASHILRTRITHFGRRCVLNGELIDLKSEVTIGAASSKGNCEAEGFLQMGESVAKDLIRANPQGVSATP
jgi:hypothetical protein